MSFKFLVALLVFSGSLLGIFASSRIESNCECPKIQCKLAPCPDGSMPSIPTTLPNGCPGCNKCAEEIQICPQIMCIQSICPDGSIPSIPFFMENGCRGCNKCKTTPNCPHIDCPPINCDNPKRTVLPNGCPGCPKCPKCDKKPHCVRLHCPQIHCDNPKPTFLPNGCRGCPKCETNSNCDEILNCPMEYCENPTPTVLPNGCPGCNSCHCPILSCPKIGCVGVTIPQYDENGCPDCPICLQKPGK